MCEISLIYNSCRIYFQKIYSTLIVYKWYFAHTIHILSLSLSLSLSLLQRECPFSSIGRARVHCARRPGPAWGKICPGYNIYIEYTWALTRTQNEWAMGALSSYNNKKKPRYYTISWLLHDTLSLFSGKDVFLKNPKMSTYINHTSENRHCVY